jgi:hypothetical protein
MDESIWKTKTYIEEDKTTSQERGNQRKFLELSPEFELRLLRMAPLTSELSRWLGNQLAQLTMASKVTMATKPTM